jgi:hypothetical protein
MHFLAGLSLRALLNSCANATHMDITSDGGNISTRCTGDAKYIYGEMESLGIRGTTELVWAATTASKKLVDLGDIR